MRTRRASCKAMRRDRSAYGAQREQELGLRSRAGPAIVVSRDMVQRGQRQSLFPGPGSDCLGDDDHRRRSSPPWWSPGNGNGERSRRCSSRPCEPGEFLISKFVPYFGLGMIGFVLCLLAAQFLFHVPLRGSLSAALSRLDGLPRGRLRDWAARVHAGQEPVPRQPVGHAADVPAGDDAVGFPLRPSQHAGGHSGQSLMPCRRDMRSRYCKPSISRATSAA